MSPKKKRLQQMEMKMAHDKLLAKITEMESDNLSEGANVASKIHNIKKG